MVNVGKVWNTIEGYINQCINTHTNVTIGGIIAHLEDKYHISVIDDALAELKKYHYCMNSEDMVRQIYRQYCWDYHFQDLLDDEGITQ